MDESEAARIIALALRSPDEARLDHPDYRLSKLVSARIAMDDFEVSGFADAAGVRWEPVASGGEYAFYEHLRIVIDRFGLSHLFTENGLGSYHHRIQPAGYDFDAEEVIAEEMEGWRARYRDMTTERQMLAATILWLYRAGPDRRWLRRVPCTWHVADGVHRLRQAGAYDAWLELVLAYPGW